MLKYLKLQIKQTGCKTSAKLSEVCFKQV